jgi:tetratricopeptide (TPR) repeat protein
MYGNLAGLYTCGSNQVRSPEKALALIQKARELVPEKKGWLSVLQGVAWYRLGKWQEARNWLSALIPGDGSPPPAPGDWTTDVPFLKRAALEGDRQSYSLALFFLAMSEWQLGDRDRARQLYHQGGRAAIESKGGHMAIEDIRTEAARLLGILEQLPAPQEVPPEAGSARDRNFEKKGNF